MSLRRFIAMLLIFVVVAAMVPMQVRAANVTINYFTFSAAPDHLKDLDTIIAGFKKDHPDIDIKVTTAPFADYFTLLQTDLVGGKGPDVFELNFENFVTYASKGTLLDLSTQTSADKSWKADVYYPRALGAFQLGSKQFALPESFSTVLMFYNKTLFDAAKVAYPKADWTWDDAIAAGKKLTDKSKGVWGIYSPVQFWEFYKKAAQEGKCKILSDDGKTSTINSPDCVATLEKMLSLFKEGVMPTAADLGGVKDDELFKSGKLAMYVTGIWMFASFKDAKFDWDIELEPGINQKAHHFFANGLAVNANTKNAAEAYQWARYMTSSDVMAKTRVATGWELPALTDQTLVADYLKVTPPANRPAVFKALESLVTPPVIARQNEMQDKINAALDKAVSGELTPQQALDQAKKDVDPLLQ